MILALNIQRNKIPEAEVLDSNNVSLVQCMLIYAIRIKLYLKNQNIHCLNSIISGNKTSKIGSVYIPYQIAMNDGKPISNFCSLF